MSVNCNHCGSSLDEGSHFCESCGAEVGSVRQSQGAQTDALPFGPYRLSGVIGRGASGTVYLATEEASGEQVAVKVLDPALGALPGLAERLETESTVLATLSDPHLVRVRRTGTEDGRRYLAMDYVDGASLRAVERQAGRLSAPQALGVVAGGLEGLSVAHARGLVHGDLKPENILVDRSGTATIVDFGQVVAVGSATEGGTPAYMSPEAARGLPLDARSDLYSMGVVLYEALAGRLPFEASNDLALLRMHDEELPPLVDGLSTPMQTLLARALAKDPDARPPDAATFLAELEEAAAAEEGGDWKRASRSRYPRGVRHHRDRPARRPHAGGRGDTGLRCSCPEPARGYLRREGRVARVTPGAHRSQCSRARRRPRARWRRHRTRRECLSNPRDGVLLEHPDVHVG